MSRGVQLMTEEVITRYQREGRGKGKAASYLPWVFITDLYSEGRTHEPYSHLTGRNHQLLSDGEQFAFVMLERDKRTQDIREGYPLDRELTQETAFNLGISHPYYVGTHVPYVLTLDFLVTFIIDGETFPKAFSVKTASDIEKPEVIERLEIERATCGDLGIEWHLLVKELMPKQKVRNLLWIRDAQLDADATEPFPGYYEEHKARMASDIRSRRYDGSLVDYCDEYNRRYSVAEPSTGLRAARMLLQQRTLAMDLNNPNPQTAHMSSFTLAPAAGRHI